LRSPLLYFNLLKRFRARIVGIKTDVINRMPVQGEINWQPLLLKSPGSLLNIINVMNICPRDSQGSGLQLREIGLNVNDDYTGIFRSYQRIYHGHPPLSI
jgi:hypothetical protein